MAGETELTGRDYYLFAKATKCEYPGYCSLSIPAGLVKFSDWALRFLKCDPPSRVEDWN